MEIINLLGDLGLPRLRDGQLHPGSRLGLLEEPRQPQRAELVLSLGVSEKKKGKLKWEKFRMQTT